MFGVLAVNAVFGFVVPGIAWQAHLGGLVTGVVLAGAITATSAQGRRRLQLPALAAVFVLVGVAVVAKYAVTDNSILDAFVGLGA